MKRILRWLAAGLVTIVAFSVITWICGALVLPHVLKDPAVRWGLAGALGAAVAALAATWGHSFAESGQYATTSRRDRSDAPKIGKTGSGSAHNKISGGTFHGPVTQGRDSFGVTAGGSAAPTSPEPPAK